MLAAAKSDFEPDAIDRGIEKSGKIFRLRAGNVQRELRQQLIDEVGLVRAQPVTLAPAKERALPANGGRIAGRCIATAGILVGGTHRKSEFKYNIPISATSDRMVFPKGGLARSCLPVVSFSACLELRARRFVRPARRCCAEAWRR